MTKKRSGLKKIVHPIRAALLGKGITRSRTPEMHMAEGRAQAIEYCYDRLDTSTEPLSEYSLAELLDLAEADGLAGLNITHPFKIPATQHMHELSAEAKILGAVNTVVFCDGRRSGYNTDYSGFLRAFQNEMADAAKTHVLLVGAGGAGSAVALALIDSGVARLTVSDQSVDHALALVSRLSTVRQNTKYHTLNAINDLDFSEIDGIINATPMGMAEYPGTAINVEALSLNTWVADIVYFPLETEFIKRAGQHGCRLMLGSGMAIYQAMDSFRLLTGLEPNLERFSEYFNQYSNN